MKQRDNSKRRLVEVMSRLDKTFKLNEGYMDEPMVFNDIRKNFGVPQGADLRMKNIGDNDVIEVYYYSPNTQAKEWADKIKSKYSHSGVDITFTDTSRIGLNESDESNVLNIARVGGKHSARDAYKQWGETPTDEITADVFFDEWITSFRDEAKKILQQSDINESKRPFKRLVIDRESNEAYLIQDEEKYNELKKHGKEVSDADEVYDMFGTIWFDWLEIPSEIAKKI